MNPLAHPLSVAMRRRIAWLLPVGLFGLFVPLRAQEPPLETLPPERFGFSLIPNAFSSNPQLTMTVNTVLTEYGRALPPPSPADPVLFVPRDSGAQLEGDIIGGDRPVLPAALKDALFRSLARRGYQPVVAGQPAKLLLDYYWGSHHRLDLDMAANFPELDLQYTLEKAWLVGGPEYRHDLFNVYAYGDTLNDRTPRKMFLRHQALGDLYFVVVSAYEYHPQAADKWRLLWRTTMTVGTNGVSMADSVPGLVMTASDYFGREMPEPLAVNRRVRRGTVTLGPMRVYADLGQTPAQK